MPVRETVQVGWQVELSDLRREMSQIPGIGEDAARKMVKGLEKQFKDANKLARNAARNAKAEWEGRLNDIHKASTVAFGGVINDVGDVVKGIAALGPVGAIGVGSILAIGGAAVGAAAGMGAVVLAADDIAESIEYLTGLPSFQPLDEDTTNSIENANAALGALSAIAGEAIVVLAGEFAPAVEEGAVLVTQLGLMALDAWENMASGKDMLREIAVGGVDFLIRRLMDLMSAGILPLMEGLGAIGELVGFEDNPLTRLSDAADNLAHSLAEGVVDVAFDNIGTAVDDLTESTKDYRAEAVALIGKVREHEGAAGRAAKADKEWARQQREAAEAAKDQEKALRELNDAFHDQISAGQKLDDIYGSTFDDVATKSQKARDAAMAQKQAAYDAAQAEIDALNRQGLSHEELADQIAQVEQRLADTRVAISERLNRDLAKINTDDFKEKFGQYEQLGVAVTDLLEQAADREFEKRKENIDDLKSAREKAIEDEDTLAVMKLNEQIAREEKAALKAFRMKKALAMAQVIMEAAINVVEAFPDPIQIALATISGVAGAAAIAGTKMQIAHTGSGIASDEVLIRKNELPAVLTRQAQQALGGEQGLARLNRGEAPGAGGTIIVKYQHRELNAIAADNVRMQSSPIRKFVKGKNRVGHSRRKK